MRYGCSSCPIKDRCTTGNAKRLKRWEHAAVLDFADAELKRHPDAMRRRKALVEHPFSAIKKVLVLDRSKRSHRRKRWLTLFPHSLGQKEPLATVIRTRAPTFDIPKLSHLRFSNSRKAAGPTPRDNSPEAQSCVARMDYHVRLRRRLFRLIQNPRQRTVEAIESRN
jgi:hypothetical protein